MQVSHHVPTTQRWIKFEEDLEEDADRWNKPHIATRSLCSLFELCSCVLRGSVQLDLDAENLCQIADLILDNLVTNNYLKVEYRSLVQDALLQRYCHHSNSHSSGIAYSLPAYKFTMVMIIVLYSVIKLVLPQN